MKSLSPALVAALPLVLVFALSPLVTGCGGDPKPPPVTTPPVATAPPTPTTTSAPGKSEKMAVNVDDDIIKACNLKFENIEDAPKFDYDQETLTPG
ncbi:MAG: peptidoglycan-associated lipoprotein, partial [Myxococcales bacterium]|nr:peptidoglycan-associated lipoprotein [Myxococcales bacterium]